MPRPIRRKNPVIAAILAFVFGPFGYLYIGWRFTLTGLLIFFIFAALLAIINWPIPPWMKYIILIPAAWKGHQIASLKNSFIEANAEAELRKFNTFTVALMAMTELVIAVGMFYGGAITLYASFLAFTSGEMWRGIYFLVGTPFVVYISLLIFGLIAKCIDSIVAKDFENIFRS